MKINLPNQITLGRLVLAIIFFVCLAYVDVKAEPLNVHLLEFCFVLFVVAAATDALDGYLARKHNQETSFGRVIDPFVDKILIIGAYVFFAGKGFVNVEGVNESCVTSWMVVVILGRELAVTSLRGVTEASGQAFGANIYGKIKMVLQSITIGWVLATIAHPTLVPFLTMLRPWVVYGTVAITLLSILPYLKMARGVLSQMSKEN